MKKLGLVLLITFLCFQAYTQETVVGKYKGKSLILEYYKGTPDIIKSIDYEKVNDLEKEIATLKSQIKKPSGKDPKIVEKLGLKIDSLIKEIGKLESENSSMTSEIGRNNDTINKLKPLINKIIGDLENKDREIAKLNNKVRGTAQDVANAGSSLGFSIGLGMPFMQNKSLDKDIWAVDRPLSQQYSLYYESPLSSSNLVSWGLGVGITKYTLSAHFSSFGETVNGLVDVDGDLYNEIGKYNYVNEKVSLMYLDVPLFLSFGQARIHRIDGYFKIGITPSFNLQKKFQGEGTYNISGYYPTWDVALHDIDELNFSSHGSCYQEVDFQVNTFVLWGNISGGIHIPLSNLKEGKMAKFILKIGGKIDYSITPLSKQLNEPVKGAAYRNNQSNILASKTRILSPEIEIGIIFSFAKPKDL